MEEANKRPSAQPFTNNNTENQSQFNINHHFNIRTLIPWRFHLKDLRI